MMQRTRRGLLLLFAPAFLSLLLVSAAAHAEDWTGAPLHGVWGSSGSNVFAAGSNGVILHYNGSAWTTMTSSETKNLSGVWGSSASDVFVVGSDGTIWHYNGSAWSDWTTMHSGITNNLSGIWGSSASDVFAAGSNGVILHYNGSAWTAMKSGTASLLTGVWGSSGNDVFAVGINGTVLHYNGSAWAAMTSSTTNDLYGVWGSSASDVFAVGAYGTVLHYNGRAWTAMASGTTNHLYGVGGSPGSGVFGVGASGTVLHYDGSAWTAMTSSTTDDLHSIWGITENDVFSVGSGGILHYDGRAWTAIHGIGYDEPDKLSARQRGRPARAIWYIGIGPSQASIHSNYSAIGDKSAGGYALVGGVEFAGTWSVEMFISAGHHIATGPTPTTTIYYPADTAEYSVVAFNLRKGLWSLEENWWTPWVAFGFGIGQVYWDTYYYELTGGWSPAFSGGVDMRMGNTPLTLRAQVMFHSFSATDTYDYGPYDVSARVVSALLVYRFR